jgi:hypothetical protein
LLGNGMSDLRPGRFIPWERVKGTHSIGGWTHPNPVEMLSRREKTVAPTGNRTRFLRCLIISDS